MNCHHSGWFSRCRLSYSSNERHILQICLSLSSLGRTGEVKSIHGWHQQTGDWTWGTESWDTVLGWNSVSTLDPGLVYFVLIAGGWLRDTPTLVLRTSMCLTANYTRAQAGGGCMWIQFHVLFSLWRLQWSQNQGLSRVLSSTYVPNILVSVEKLKELWFSWTL